jgi:hypothetical protein
VRVNGKPAPQVLFRPDSRTVGHRDVLACYVWATKAWSTLAPRFREAGRSVRRAARAIGFSATPDEPSPLGALLAGNARQ